MLTKYTRSALLAVLCGVAIIAWLEKGAAQSIGGGSRRPGGSSEPIPRASDAFGATTRPSAGATYGRILRYTALDWLEEGEPIGSVTLKPAEFGSRVQMYYLLAGAEPAVNLPLDCGWGEPYEDLLGGGLYCTLHWREMRIPDSARRMSRIVTRVEFSQIVTTGKVLSLMEDGEEVVKLRVKPIGGAPWPHLLAQLNPRSDPQTDRVKARLTRPLVLCCNVLPDLTVWLTPGGEPTSSTDFHEDQSIQAAIVIGTPRGRLISIQPDELPPG